MQANLQPELLSTNDPLTKLDAKVGVAPQRQPLPSLLPLLFFQSFPLYLLSRGMFA